MIPGLNLTADKAAAAKRAAEELVERVVISGDGRKGFLGLVNQSTVPQVAVANGAGGSPLWANKTPAEILTDVNNALVSAWSTTQQVELHDTVLLPVTQFGIIASTPRSPNTDTTIITYLQANNIYTSTTRQAADHPDAAAARGRRSRRHQPHDHLPARPAGAEIPYAHAAPVLSSAAAHVGIRHPRHDAAWRPRHPPAEGRLL